MYPTNLFESVNSKFWKVSDARRIFFSFCDAVLKALRLVFKKLRWIRLNISTTYGTVWRANIVCKINYSISEIVLRQFRSTL